MFSMKSKCMPTWGGITYDKIDKLNGGSVAMSYSRTSGNKYLHEGKFTRGDKALMGPVEYEGSKGN